jgi:putative transposase
LYLVRTEKTQYHSKKKRRTYKEQCPLKREAYLSSLQLETDVRGKTPVYIDETGFATSGFREYAYALKGVAVADQVSGNRYRRTSLIAARIAKCFTAPVLFEGACDSLAFNAWIDQMLCPLLDDRHVVIMDNASFHKGSQTAALIRGCGASLLFLPPYSPELNPIEKDFANLKRMRQYNAEATLDEIIKVYQ